jgi:dsDNA-specific endonuclease/ATPase MutS2
MFSKSTYFRCRFLLLTACVLVGTAMGCPQAEAQWWKFWKKRGKEETLVKEASQSVQQSEKPAGKTLKEVEKERRDAERELRKQQKKNLKEAEEKREEVLRQTKESQKAIEKHQRNILAENKKNQRQLRRDLRSSSTNPSGKNSSFLQRYRARKSSSDRFFLSD